MQNIYDWDVKWCFYIVIHHSTSYSWICDSCLLRITNVALTVENAIVSDKIIIWYQEYSWTFAGFRQLLKSTELLFSACKYKSRICVIVVVYSSTFTIFHSKCCMWILRYELFWRFFQKKRFHTVFIVSCHETFMSFIKVCVFRELFLLLCWKLALYWKLALKAIGKKAD